MAHQQGIVEILGQVVTKQTIQGAETFEFSSNDFFLRKTKNATAVAKNLDFFGGRPLSCIKHILNDVEDSCCNQSP